jgi:ABC-type transport system involved in multi-copper enzyme maturation permease subunit
MTVAARRASLSLHPSLVVARFTLLSVVRRRWLAFAGGIGLVLLVIDGMYTKANDHLAPNSYLASWPHRLAYQVFVSSASLTAVIVAGITMVVAMSIIRDDLGTGAAELLLTKPLPRPWYALGKVATLAISVVVVAGVIGLVRAGVLLVAMGDSAYLADTVFDTLAIAADAFVLGLVILAVSSWGSSLAGALVAIILLLVTTSTAPLMMGVARHEIVDPEATLVTVAYYASPRMLSGPADHYSVNGGKTCSIQSGQEVCTVDTTPVVETSAGSSVVDMVAWAGYGAGTIVIMLLGIRRFSGRLTESG